MNKKYSLTFIFFFILLMYRIPAAAASDEILINTETIDIKVTSLDSLNDYDFFSGIDVAALTADGKKTEIQQYMVRQATCKAFENGFYEYSVHTKKNFLLKEIKGGRIQVKGTVKTYSTLECLAPKCPQPVLDLFSKSGYQLKIDKDIEKNCQIDSKKKTVTLKKATPQIYRALGLIYYKAARIENNQSWQIKCGQEADQANTTLSNFFACSFYEYCANPTNLKKLYPNTYTFMYNKFTQ